MRRTAAAVQQGLLQSCRTACCPSTWSKCHRWPVSGFIFSFSSNFNFILVPQINAASTTVCHCNLRHACLYHHCIQCRSSASSTPSPAKTDSQRASQPACSCMRRCSSHGTKYHHQKLNDDMRVHRQADIVGAVKRITQTVI